MNVFFLFLFLTAEYNLIMLMEMYETFQKKLKLRFQIILPYFCWKFLVESDPFS